ncbi:hypothetical protein [Pseudomonas guariconensis]|uniref:hypothetical protein n=1 Tax=Pseudomonas TaxID=286 RepID=UPI00209ACFA7|nr:hypothetical protein [Pseudomonas guariconensis]MCO7634075.1 hypothetical protein [Pseudomonas guariconensis]
MTTPFKAYTLGDDFAVREVIIVRKGLFCVDSKGVKHPRPKLFTSAKAAQDKARKWLADREAQLAKENELHEQRKKIVASY